MRRPIIALVRCKGKKDLYSCDCCDLVRCKGEKDLYSRESGALVRCKGEKDLYSCNSCTLVNCKGQKDLYSREFGTLVRCKGEKDLYSWDYYYATVSYLGYSIQAKLSLSLSQGAEAENQPNVRFLQLIIKSNNRKYLYFNRKY